MKSRNLAMNVQNRATPIHAEMQEETGKHGPSPAETRQRAFEIYTERGGLLSGSRLNTRIIMSRMEAPNGHTDLRAHFASTRGGSLLEVDAWRPGELKAISPLVDA
jgi:hypothetical protein